ncbi:autotransporter assembly complex protein TamA [Parasphingorhabdus halotolerans]|uniref:autotransporter assembly complex protein TamA n=1 Tax=Parasphingorhabdus halotolerans TaxID=2725558 RepID=UPI001FEAF0C8|nr:BamA/TamA family outer membrane protein [Parasphingorhabdus halotolerans]
MYRSHLFACVASISAATICAPLWAQTSAGNREAAAAPDILDNDQPLDPDQPLTEFPDFGVDWPDLENLPDPVVSDLDSTDDSSNVSASAQDGFAETENVDPTAQLPSNFAETDGSIIADGPNNTAFAETFAPDGSMTLSNYDIRFSGLPDAIDEKFGIRFDSLSVLKQYQNDQANFAQIKRRAETDTELVERLLRIEGYYDAIVRNRFEEAGKAAGSNDILVVINIVAGPQYKFADILLPGLETAAGSDPANFRSVFGLEPGAILNSDGIIAAQLRLDEAMAENGYAFSKTGEPDLVIDHADRNGDLTQPVMPGGKYNFGAIKMASTELFGPEHAQLIARFEPGDIYKASDVEDLRRALISTGLISTITMEPVISDDPDKVDLAINLTPAPLRTIAGELGYGTGEGARAEVSWEHRNLFPPEGLIRLTGVLATQEQSGSVTFRRNNHRRRDNVLNGRVALNNIDRPAFEARTFSVGANIERQSNLIYQKKWSWSAGLELIASQERDVVGTTGQTSRQTFFIGALPVSVTYDASDDLLDPQSGFRIGARISPEASFQNGSFFYTRGQIDGSAYYPVSEKIVMAGRMRLGSIVGAGNNRIAPSRRLYSGGGGSVRGYGYQRIGPLDANDDPIGGRSLVEFSLEARIRIDAFGGNFGVVPFIDAGNVYTNPLPRFSGFQYGAGIGLRYYSNFGPIRIDLGTPVNPQPGDSPVALYVSLGQAF